MNNEEKIYEIVKDILIIPDSKKGNYRPIKNTNKQEIYKAILKIQKILNVPYRIDFDIK